MNKPTPGCSNPGCSNPECTYSTCRVKWDRVRAAAPEVTEAAKRAWDFLAANYDDEDMPDILIPLRAALAKAGR